MSDKAEDTLQKLLGDPSPGQELSTKEAYFASLAEWAKQASIAQNAMTMFPYYLMANYPQLFQGQTSASHPASLGQLPASPAIPAQGTPSPVAPPTGPPQAPPAFNRFRVLDEAQQFDIIHRIGGYEYVVAPFWKRAVAEAIDVFILFILKIIITFGVVNLFDLEFDKEMMRRTLDEDDLFINFFDISLDFITMSSDLLLIELLTKITVCCYEALWTVFYNGATPGKSLMKIRIHYVEAVMPLQAPALPQFVLQPQREPLRALIYPAQTPTLMRAFARALAKNLVMTLLFPICVVMIFFKNNRTAYDILTKTIVVETDSNAIFRTHAPHQRQR
ncbi:protein FAM8A1 [Drosophila bipectinata]|uniref:protein FAM8A1 n=1 Tax=Drosophila bipectinata TaxID=42026 RepID=UPI001C8A5234|nr:protein FAM8A1 [Drosophila bipectinata]